MKEKQWPPDPNWKPGSSVESMTGLRHIPSERVYGPWAVICEQLDAMGTIIVGRTELQTMGELIVRDDDLLRVKRSKRSISDLDHPVATLHPQYHRPDRSWSKYPENMTRDFERDWLGEKPTILLEDLLTAACKEVLSLWWVLRPERMTLSLVPPRGDEMICYGYNDINLSVTFDFVYPPPSGGSIQFRNGVRINPVLVEEGEIHDYQQVFGRWTRQTLLDLHRLSNEYDGRPWQQHVNDIDEMFKEDE